MARKYNRIMLGRERTLILRKTFQVHFPKTGGCSMKKLFRFGLKVILEKVKLLLV